ncbi:DUF1294 domain-containing protein [Pseudoxanthomonas sp. NC8]|nr:DUF1294 domain-containing protein [Pseudoxanthomonas sp. NC8]
MASLGRIVDWNEARGFGFIQPLATSQPRLFFHIRDYRQGRTAPGTGRAGEIPCATAGRRPLARGRRLPCGCARATGRGGGARASPPLPAWPGWLLAGAHAAGIAWATHGGRMPMPGAAFLLALCCVAWIAYALDKHAAQRGRRRIPESTLHLLELAGGWPGAFVAQRMLHHKTRKRSYRIAFWCL